MSLSAQELRQTGPTPVVLRNSWRGTWESREFALVVGAALIGVVGSCLLVATGGRLARAPGVTPPHSWWGLLSLPSGRGTLALLDALEIAAVALLVVAWCLLLRSSRLLSGRIVLGIGLLWALPFVAGPPVMSLDIYSYLAQGHLSRLGLDPYQHGPSALGESAWLRAVDPFWRHSRSPYGPLAVLAQHGLAWFSHPVVALVVAHLVALAALAAFAVVVTQLVDSRQRAGVLLLTVANPLVLIQLLGAAHWDVVMVALLGVSVLSWQRDRAFLAIVLASSAAAIKLPAGFAVAVLVVLSVLTSPQGSRFRRAGSAVIAAAIPWILLSLVVPNSLGFLSALATPLSGRTLYAPTTVLAEICQAIFNLTGVPSSFDVLLSASRLGGMVVAAAICGWLLATAQRRPAAATIGQGLLIVALLGPVLYPWYLTWGLLTLALAGDRFRRLIVGLSAAASFTALPGCKPLGLLLLDSAPPLAVLFEIALVLTIALPLCVGLTRPRSALRGRRAQQATRLG